VERRLVALEKNASEFAPVEIVVVGSGYCGIELSATLAERLGKKGRIKVVDMAFDIVAAAPAGNREAASKVNSATITEKCACNLIFCFILNRLQLYTLGLLNHFSRMIRGDFLTFYRDSHEYSRALVGDCPTPKSTYEVCCDLPRG